MTPNEKLDRLKANLISLGGVVVAFSGGVDSTFLLKIASDVLGDRAIAVTALSPIFPAWESKEAMAFAGEFGIHLVTLPFNALVVPDFARNPANRCYF